MTEYNQDYDDNLFAVCYDVEELNDDGSVCLVRDERSGRLYVRKNVSLERADIYERLSRIPSEAKARVFCVHRFRDYAVIIEELINGVTVEKYISQNGPMSPDEVMKTLRPVLGLLAEMHNINIIHRDISAGNVMIDGGSAKLIDFGISRSVKLGASSDTTIMGTAGYAPPEQFGFAQTDARSDIYSVGVLMNYMLTGEMPNKKIAGGEAGKIIRRCLSVRMEDRYSSVSELMSVIYGNGNYETAKIKKPFYKYIPGFRNGNAAHAVICMLFYAGFCGAVCAAAQNISASPDLYTILSEIWSVIGILVVPFAFMANYKKIGKIFRFRRFGAKEWILLLFIAFVIMIIIYGGGIDILKFILRV